MLKLVFLGSDVISLPALEWLADEGRGVARVVAVFTKPDRAVGRGQKVQANAIKQWALREGLPVHQPEKLTDTDRETLAAYGADASLVMAYGHILRQAFIDTPRLGTLNLHASILPKYRGASPIQTAVANGEHETGVTLMRIVPEMDAGPVAGHEGFAIAPLDTAAEVEEKMAMACIPLLARTLPRLAAGELAFAAQDASAATFCRKLEKSDGTLDFNAPAAALAARINGLMPWPACTVVIAGQPVKFGLAEAVGGMKSDAAGRVLGDDASGLLIATGEGTLRVRRFQRAGGKLLPASDFLRGFPIAVGTTLPSQAMPPLVFRAPYRAAAGAAPKPPAP